MNKLKTTIAIDIESNNDGTYDTLISTYGPYYTLQYPTVTANEIGKHVANHIDSLEKATSGNSYLDAESLLDIPLTKSIDKVKELYKQIQQCIQTTDELKSELAVITAIDSSDNETLDRQLKELRRRLAIEKCFNDATKFDETIALLTDIKIVLDTMSNANKKQAVRICPVWICREENNFELAEDCGQINELCIQKTWKEAETWVKERIQFGKKNGFDLAPYSDPETILPNNNPIFITMEKENGRYSYDICATPYKI